MAKEIFIYENRSGNNVLGKTLICQGTKMVDILKDCSRQNPILILSEQFDPISFNYCFIEEFRRYYYIKDIITLGNGMYKIVCEVDVLESFKNEIKTNSCLISRQEFEFNKRLVDPKILQEVGTITERKRIGNVGSQTSYIITVAGGSE